MSSRAPARRARRRARWPFLAGVVVALAVPAGVLGHDSLAAVHEAPPSPEADRSDGVGEDDGAVPDGTTVFDVDVPAVARLEPSLLHALRRAATDAQADRVAIVVNSGWRSPEYQERLLDQAVSKYGSRDAAVRWVATPATSAHVSGEAIDVGPARATTWLAKHGARYGLCRIYRNEPWHFELRPAAAERGCPREYADPAHDPRMR